MSASVILRVDNNIKYVSNFDVFFFKQKTAYEMRISDWSSDVCSSDLAAAQHFVQGHAAALFGQLRGDQTLLRSIESTLRIQQRQETVEIGRASCRERVCQYV